MGWFDRNRNASPAPGSKTGCLCPDNTYKVECCDGSLRAQGIGVIYRNAVEDVILIEDTLSNDEFYSNQYFYQRNINDIHIFNAGQHIITAFNDATLSGTRVVFPYALTGKIYGFILPKTFEMTTPITKIETTLSGATTLTDASFEGKELKAIHLFIDGQHITTAFNSITLTGSTLQFPYALTGKLRGVVFG